MPIARRLIPSLAKLRAFECAAKHGSFTLASKELDLTQSAISRQIRELEEQMGVMLFERVRQRVILTKAGNHLRNEAQRLLDQAEKTVLGMITWQHDAPLNVSVLQTFGSRWLIPRMSQFLAANDFIGFNMSTHSEPFDIEQAGVDAAVHYGSPMWPGGICWPIYDEAVFPVASPALIGASPAAGLQALTQGPLLHLDTRPGAWDAWLSGKGIETTQRQRGHRFDRMELLISAVVAGLGYALLPRYLIERELAENQLIIVADQPLLTGNGYYLVTARREIGNPVVSAFLDWVRTSMAGEGSFRPPS